MYPTIVLASTSRYRRALLDSLGLEYVATSPRFEELPDSQLNAAQIAVAFARGKAESLLADHPNALIIGADQTAELNGKILGKPGSVERAVEQLVELSGRTHRLNTAVALLNATKRTIDHRLLVHEMKMRALSREQIEAYVARDMPIDCAGAYKVESLGSTLFEEMRGVDHTAIVGLPITAVVDLFHRAGFDLLTRLLAS
jgi:septum formation protein